MLNNITQDSLVYDFPDILLAFGSILAIYFFIWFIGRLMVLLLKKIPWINADIKNGLRVLITLIQFTILISSTFLTLFIFRVQPEFIIGSIAILITAIGVAFTGVAANLIGGMYILTTRPFGVGDFIKTQGIEGIVCEIGINYSRLVTIDRTIVKIPNGVLMNTSLLNYIEKNEEKLSKIVPSGIFTPSKRFVIYKKMMELKLDVIEPPIPIKFVRERLDKVCTDYSDVFGTKPIYYLGKHEVRQEIFLIIRAFDGYTIFNAWPYFMESLMVEIYQELQEELSL